MEKFPPKNVRLGQIYTGKKGQNLFSEVVVGLFCPCRFAWAPVSGSVFFFFLAIIIARYLLFWKGRLSRYFLNLELTYIWRQCSSLLVIYSPHFIPYALANIKLSYLKLKWCVALKSLRFYFAELRVTQNLLKGWPLAQLKKFWWWDGQMKVAPSKENF